MLKYFLSAMVSLVLAAPAFAQLDNLAEQLRTTPITTQKIADNFHVLFGVGGNIIVSIGSSGTLIASSLNYRDSSGSNSRVSNCRSASPRS